MPETLYPPTPAIADTSFLKPSAEFKRNAGRVIIGIALFPVLYVVILILGVVLLLFLFWAAYQLFSLYSHYLIALVGTFLIMLGIVFFYFTLRFVFGTVDEDGPSQIEIEKKDHPLLFDFIRKVSSDVGVSFPKKIFLTPDVNAAVSYNSSFWSMFLPVRKNLHIGLGLVNTLNLSEFKAIIAHEFGHFSQKSMRTGSYVYTMNRVMFDLVYQRDHVEYEIREWAEGIGGGTFGSMLMLFADLTDWFVGLLRKIMYWAYSKLNVTYVALAREMEYHADLVAARVAGNEAAISALRKTHIGAIAYERTMSDLRSLTQKRAVDLYTYHSKMILLTIPDVDATPVKRRLKIRDLWASHPTREEREKNINKVSIQSKFQDESAWMLFTDPDATKREMTSLLYELNENISNLPGATDNEINAHFAEFNQPDSIFSKTFYSFYDNFNSYKIDIEKIRQSASTKSFDEIINPSVRNLLIKHYYDKIDLETLITIANQAINVEFFEYDGNRYGRKEVKRLRTAVQIEIANDTKTLSNIDEQLAHYFYRQAKEIGQGDVFLGLYTDLRDKQARYQTVVEFASRMDAMVRQIDNRRLMREDQVRGFYRSITNLEKEAREFMGEPKPGILWNSENSIHKEGFHRLHQYIAQVIGVTQKDLLTTRAKVNDMRITLVPSQFRRS